MGNGARWPGRPRGFPIPSEFAFAVTAPIRFAVNQEGQSVAYQVLGEGALDIVFIPDWVHSELYFHPTPVMKFKL